MRIAKICMSRLSDETHNDLIMNIIFAHATVVDISDEGVQKLMDEMDNTTDPKLLN
jgi:hypothetical protein